MAKPERKPRTIRKRSEESLRRDKLERIFEEMQPDERRRQLYLLNDRFGTNGCDRQAMFGEDTVTGA